jgi:FkbM family methyltransferase
MNIKNVLKKFFVRNKQIKNQKYPYVYSIREFSITDRNIKFNINNKIEEFRLRHWGHEKEYVLKVINEIRENDVFLDIGSSVGLFSLLAAYKANSGKVVSIEPDNENLAALIQNYKINRKNNFIVCNIAAGAEKGEMSLFTNGSNDYSPSLKPVNGISNFVKIKVDSIDNLISDDIIPIPNLVKIDIEGAEFIALQGMKSLLTSVNRPRIIFVAIHPEFLEAFGTSTNEILTYMDSCGYYAVEQIEREKQILCEFVLKN